MKKTFFLAVLSIVSTAQFLYAQKNILKGYIIKLNNDTVKGYIDYKNWNKNPVSINYYPTLNDKAQSLDVKSINGFGITDDKYVESYVSKAVKLETSPQQLGKLGFDKEPSFEDKVLFLRVLNEGDLTLLKYVDDRSHFFIYDGNKTEELINKRYYVNESKNQIAYNSAYKEQLKDLFINNKDINENDIEKVSFFESEIIRIVQKYNQSRPNSYKPISTKNEKLTAKFGLILGGSYSTLSFRDVDFKGSTSIIPGVSLLLTIPRSSEKLGINFDLAYRSFKFDGTYQDKQSDFQYSNQTYAFDGKYLKLSAMFRYTFASASLKPFLNLGVSSAYAFKLEENTIFEDTFHSTTTVNQRNFFDELRKFDQGALFGAGLAIKHFRIEARGEVSNGFSTITAIKTGITSGYLLVNYQF
ncbi:hypothetical protein GCM10022289_10460 [Pedobacter jeongneungensis]|uniref:Outer membrane protein beta-barrel domain-containing protein n=1 Tax=Pedobacter jeongneungensis TaxID=947309 RepID=A0ABP8B793_9SPHI